MGILEKKYSQEDKNVVTRAPHVVHVVNVVPVAHVVHVVHVVEVHGLVQSMAWLLRIR